MVESDAKWFGDNIEARWQGTQLLAMGRAFDLCKPYERNVVLLAMDKLKAATIDKLIVDADRLAAVCKQVSAIGDKPEGEALSERTRDYLARQRSEGEEARKLRDALDAMHVDPADAERAEAICRKKYGDCWDAPKSFGPKQKARLMKMELGR